MTKELYTSHVMKGKELLDFLQTLTEEELEYPVNAEGLTGVMDYEPDYVYVWKDVKGNGSINLADHRMEK